MGDNVRIPAPPWGAGTTLGPPPLPPLCTIECRQLDSRRANRASKQGVKRWLFRSCCSLQGVRRRCGGGGSHRHPPRPPPPRPPNEFIVASLHASSLEFGMRRFDPAGMHLRQWGRDVSEVVPALAIHSILQIKPAWKVNISCPRDKEASQAGRFVTLCLAEKLQSMMTAL